MEPKDWEDMSEELPVSIHGVLEHQAEAIGDKTFLFFEDRVISYSEINRLTNRAANGLRALGVNDGVGVAIMMPNSPEWFSAYCATQKLGSYAVPINTGLKGEGLRYILDHSDSSILIVHPDYAESIRAMAPSLAKLETIIINDNETGPDWLPPEGWMRLGDLMDASEENPGGEIDPEWISALMYTSGTTGPPKGVVSRYKGSPVSAARLLGAFVQEGEVLYTCLPLFHANALFLSLVRSLVLGIPVALSRRFSASRFWDEIRRYGVTSFNALGAMIPILMKQPERDNDADNKVRLVFSAACPASVWAEFEQRFGVHIVEAYAAVDGGGYMVLNVGNCPKGSFGKPSTPVRIVDDDGLDVPSGQPGELLFEVDDLKRRKVEYFNNEAAGEERIRDGWFYTGDLVTADEAGNLYFVDRKTDSLRRRGENISSWEVEREINTHPAVLESAVFGVPSEFGEDEVMAAVVLQPGQTLDGPELISHCEEHMAEFMLPRFVALRDSLPKTATHRVQKAVLKKEGVGPHTWDREAP